MKCIHCHVDLNSHNAGICPDCEAAGQKTFVYVVRVGESYNVIPADGLKEVLRDTEKTGIAYFPLWLSGKKCIELMKCGDDKLRIFAEILWNSK